MRRGGAQWRHPYEVRLNAVRQYLTGDESAAEIATSLGVTVSTMRRYVRDLRGILEGDTPTATSPNGPTHT